MNLTSKITSKFSKLAIDYVEKIQVRKLQKKVQDLKLQRQQQNYQYKENPKLSIILQFFNKKKNIKKIIEHLRITSADEIIVIDDGSIDDSYKDWIKYLDRPNDFLLRCNDLFEVRTYDRAIKMARGEYVCLLQDDDILPSDNTWIENALTLFYTFPDLLILGGREGVEIILPDSVDSDLKWEYKGFGNTHEWSGICKYRIYDTPLYQEAISGIPFMFTMTVNRAPVFLRREQFLEIGGVNQEYAPFQCDDVDASIKAWLSGYKVGMYNCPCIRDVGTGGMRLYNNKSILNYSEINWQKIYDKYHAEISNGNLQNLVNKANTCFNKNITQIEI